MKPDRTRDDELRAQIAAARATIDDLVASLREAQGTPPSEHSRRRLEEMASRLEKAAACHPPLEGSSTPVCATCLVPLPCATLRAIYDRRG
jgi:hypothetical protein